jgi:hypothetical protein
MNNGIIRMADELRRLAAIFAAIFAATLTPVLAADDNDTPGCLSIQASPARPTTCPSFIPRCDVLIQRFEDAPRILALKQLKWPLRLDLDQELAADTQKLKDEKNPAYFGPNPTLVVVYDQVYDFHDDESDSDLSVHCNNEHFAELTLYFYRPTSSWYRTTSKRPAPHPYLDYIAAAIYGVTAWPADQVMKTAGAAWKIKLGLRGIKPSDPDYLEAGAAEISGQNEKYNKPINLIPGLCAAISWGHFTIGVGGVELRPGTCLP